MTKLLSVLILVLSFQAHSAVVGIVDSGFYADHELLKNNLWINEKEKGNRIDDDENGYVDDLYGWNFAENSKILFDDTQVENISEITYKLISIGSKMMGGTITEEDKEFIKKNLIDIPKDEQMKLIEEINFYGQHAHGTHVAGIVAKENPNVELINLRFFPSSVAPYSTNFWGKVENFAFGAIADAMGGVFNQAIDYVGLAGASVVNMSLGVPMERFAGFVLTIKGNKEPTLEELAAESQKIYAEFEAKAKKWANTAPHTLLVVAAGNSGIDNDLIPAFPANVDIPNLISVAATIGISSLPEFSNYGATTVDVAAPGVDILSSAPGPTMDFEIEMTGTSMAAPYVAGVASRVADANTKLTPSEMKQILIETVDKKDWLVGKVLSEGVVNAERAVLAAKLSQDRSLDVAIAESLVSIADQVETNPVARNFRSNFDRELADILKHFVF